MLPGAVSSGPSGPQAPESTLTTVRPHDSVPRDLMDEKDIGLDESPAGTDNSAKEEEFKEGGYGWSVPVDRSLVSVHYLTGIWQGRCRLGRASQRPYLGTQLVLCRLPRLLPAVRHHCWLVPACLRLCWRLIHIDMYVVFQVVAWAPGKHADKSAGQRSLCLR